MIPISSSERHPDGTLRTLKPPQTRHDETPLDDVLRAYAVELRVVDATDNHGELCGWCQERTNNANTYYRDWNGEDHCEDSCTQCVPVCLDTEWDVDPAWTVVVEVAW